MITVDDATEVLNRFSLDRRTSVKLKDSFGRILAENIVSGIDVPSFDRSDMDGYAIRDRDLDGRRFKLVGEMHAGGDLEVAIGEGECSYVATGANIPDGANLVIPVENTERRRRSWRRELVFGCCEVVVCTTNSLIATQCIAVGNNKTSPKKAQFVAARGIYRCYIPPR